MYYQLRNASAWEGPALNESDSGPLTHDILSALDPPEIHSKLNEVQVFEENCEKLRSRMTLDNADLARRRGYTNSKVENNNQEKSGRALSGDHTSDQPKASSCTQVFDLPSVASSPVTQSTVLGSVTSSRQQTSPATVWRLMLQESTTFTNDLQPYIPEWEQALAETNKPFQAHCDEHNSFDTLDSWWESALVLHDLHQIPLASEIDFSMPDTSESFHVDYTECYFNEFI
jgi:hypothetical protein